MLTNAMLGNIPIKAIPKRHYVHFHLNVLDKVGVASIKKNVFEAVLDLR